MKKLFKNNKKIFVFYGNDIAQYNIKFDEEIIQKGYSILALDVSAVAIASQYNVPYTVIDDWLDDATFKKALDNASYCEGNWFVDAYDDFCIDGICWPEFDHHAMSWFWREVCLAEAFANEFLNQKGESLLIYKRREKHPFIYYYSPQDIGKEILISILKEKVKIQYPLCISKEPIYHIIFNKIIHAIHIFKKYLSSNSQNKKELPQDYGLIKDKLLFAINPGESQRFSQIIESVKKEYFTECCVVILSTDQVIVDNLSKQWNIPIMSAGIQNPLSPGINDTLLSALIKVKKMSNGKAWNLALHVLDYHFHHYCTSRWPRLINEYYFWFDLLKKFPPKAVFVSSLSDAESQIPTITAKKLDILTFSMPHGQIQAISKPIISEYILCGGLFQCLAYEKMGIPSYRLLPCKDAHVKNEYAVIKNGRHKNESKLNIIVLTTSGGNKGLIYLMGLRSQIQGFTILDNIPWDLKDRISISIKVHPNPGYSETELINSATIDAKNFILPLNSNLEEVLESCDLVIMLKTMLSSSFIHAIYAEKPIILFENGFNYSKSKDLYDFPFRITVSNADELWNCIRKVCGDSNFLQEMINDTKKYKDKFVNIDEYPEICKIIKMYLMQMH